MIYLKFLILENEWKDFSEQPKPNISNPIWVKYADNSIRRIEVREDHKDKTLNEYFPIIAECEKNKIMTVNKKIDPSHFAYWQPVKSGSWKD